MALMRTRRGEDPSKKKGVEPTKTPSNDGQTRKQYTWEDVSRNEDIKAKNRASKAKYESDVQAYNKAMKLYNEGINPSESTEKGGVKAFQSATVRGKKSSFDTSTERFSAASSNKMLDENIKSGKYVSINDPSIDANTRKLIMGTRMGKTGASKDMLGETSGEFYVPKGTKFSSYKEIYGEDFNPEEWDKAARSGNLDKYTKQKGLEGKAFQANTGLMERYKVPKASNQPNYEPELDIKSNELPPVSKMRTLKKGEAIDKTGKITKPIEKLSISPKKEEQAPEWEAPSRKYMKTKSGKKIAYNVSAGEFIGGEINRGKQKDGSVRLGSYLAPKSKSKVKESGFQYNREGKMAKAYFGGGFEKQTTSDINEKLASIKKGKQEFRQGIKELRKGKGTPSETLTAGERIQGYREGIKELRAEKREAKLAGKYLKKTDNQYTGAYEGKESSPRSKVKFFTPEAMSGYGEFANYRKSTDNAANRNTISNQEKTLTFREKIADGRASRLANKPTTSLKDQRAQRRQEKDLMKSVDKKLKNQ
jgi:hypothetical protein